MSALPAYETSSIDRRCAAAISSIESGGGTAGAPSSHIAMRFITKL
jgi:hypothetical protein